MLKECLLRAGYWAICFTHAESLKPHVHLEVRFCDNFSILQVT